MFFENGTLRLSTIACCALAILLAPMAVRAMPAGEVPARVVLDRDALALSHGGWNPAKAVWDGTKNAASAVGRNIGKIGGAVAVGAGGLGLVYTGMLGFVSLLAGAGGIGMAGLFLLPLTAGIISVGLIAGGVYLLTRKGESKGGTQ